MFSVYTPSETQLNYFRFGRRYWEEDLYPKLRDFYMGEFVPRAILKQRGLIRRGHIDPEPFVIMAPALPAAAFVEPIRRPSRRSARDLDGQWEDGRIVVESET